MLGKKAGVIAAGLAGVAVVVGFGFSGLGAAGLAAVRASAGPSPAIQVVDPVLSTVWCSGPSRCLGVGADRLNGSASAIWNGRSWRFVKTPGRGLNVTALGCSGWTECMAVGGGTGIGIIDEWNGTSWKTLPPVGSTPLDSVACAARHRCVAFGFDEALAWNGKAWSRVPLPRQIPGGSVFPAVACAGPADCMAVGSPNGPGSLAIRWNGVKWHRVADSGIGCGRPGQCGVSADGRGRYVAVGANISSFWNGRSWRQVTLPAVNDELPGVSCAGSFCLAIGSSSEFGWNGKTWNTLPAAGFTGASVWCTRPTACMDVGSGTASIWNGRQWAQLRLSVVDRFSAVSCSRPANCIAVGTTNKPALERNWLAERWNGSRWRVIPGPAKTVGIGQEQISCTSTQFCMALNTNAVDPGAQRWDGRQWIATNLPLQVSPGSNFGIEGLSCSSASNCVAVAGDVSWTWNGTSWSEFSPAISGETVDMQSVSCVSATMCMATGFDFSGDCQDGCTFNGLAQLWNGASWSVSDNPVLGPGTLDNVPTSQISCPTTAFCMEETNAPGVMSVRSWNGLTWAPQTVPFFHAFAISCGGTSSCVVMTPLFFRNGALVGAPEIWNGQSWRATSPAPGGGLSGLSCSRPDRCVAVGATDRVLTMAQFWDGSVWKLGRPANP